MGVLVGFLLREHEREHAVARLDICAVGAYQICLRMDYLRIYLELIVRVYELVEKAAKAKVFI